MIDYEFYFCSSSSLNSLGWIYRQLYCSNYIHAWICFIVLPCMEGRYVAYNWSWIHVMIGANQRGIIIAKLKLRHQVGESAFQFLSWFVPLVLALNFRCCPTCFVTLRVDCMFHLSRYQINSFPLFLVPCIIFYSQNYNEVGPSVGMPY